MDYLLVINCNYMATTFLNYILNNIAKVSEEVNDLCQEMPSMIILSKNYANLSMKHRLRIIAHFA